MNVAIFIDSEDLALAINKLLTVNGISSEVIYKDNSANFDTYDIAIVSEDRVVQSSVKKIILTYNSGLVKNKDYLLRPFKSAELIKKIEESFNAC